MTQYTKKLIQVTFFFLFLQRNMTQIAKFINRVKKSTLNKQLNMTQIANLSNRVKKSTLNKQRNMTQISIFSYRVNFHYFNTEYIGWIEYDVFNPTFFRLFIVLTQLNFNINIIFCHRQP